MRKSKEHNDIYWFPSQSESTPVPFQHERDFTIVRSLYKPIPRLLLQSSNKTTKNNPLGFFTNLFPTILDNKISTTKNNPLGFTILIMRTILSLINNPCFQQS